MTKVERVRIGIIAALAVLIVVVIGYSTLYALNLVPGSSTDVEENFRTLDRELISDPVEVVEFFSYTCPFCYALEPMVEDWLADLPEGVEFRRIHVAFDTRTSRLARTFQVLESQNLLPGNHVEIFEAIHDRDTLFLSDDAIANFLQDQGVDREQFMRVFGGRQIARQIQVDMDLIREVGGGAVPAMFVANKYMVSAQAGNRTMLDTVDWLIGEIRANRAPTGDVPSEELHDTEEETS